MVLGSFYIVLVGSWVLLGGVVVGCGGSNPLHSVSQEHSKRNKERLAPQSNPPAPPAVRAPCPPLITVPVLGQGGTGLDNPLKKKKKKKRRKKEKKFQILIMIFVVVN